MLVISISFERVYFFLVPSRRYVGDQECLLFDERFLQSGNLMVIYSIKICFIANSHLEMATILLPNKSAVTRIKSPTVNCPIFSASFLVAQYHLIFSCGFFFVSTSFFFVSYLVLVGSIRRICSCRITFSSTCENDKFLPHFCCSVVMSISVSELL